MFKYTIFLLFVSFAASLAADEDKPEPSILGNTTDLKNVQFFLQNATDMFEKWMNGSNTEAGNQIVNLLKGFLSGGKDDGDKSSDSNNTGSLQNLLKFVEPVIPLFTGKGQVDTNQLMALVSSAIAGAENALTSTGVSRECANDVQQMFYGLQHTQTWALKMIDAAFKIPSGLADYNLKWLGNRDECLTIISDPSDDVTGNKQQFHGKYCRLALPLGNVPNAGEQTLILGACASHRCSNDDVTILVKTVVSQITSGAFSAVYVSCIEDNLELDTGAKAAISILVVLGIMIIMGTLYDVVVIQLSACESSSSDVVLKHVNAPFTDLGKLEGQTNGAFVNEKNGTNVEMKGYAESKTIQPQQNMSSITDPKQNKPKRGVLANILLAFSVYTNGCKLLGTNQGSGTLGAVNGIRFLSMAWVILGHTLYFAFNYGANTGSFGPKKMFQESFMAILYATVSVDSFFALSGTLVAYLTLREIKKVGGPKKLNWFMFYFHRFWRLTPPYMLILMVGTTLYKYVGTGAMKPDGDSYMMAACRDNWWTNIIYLNNYINTDRSCMGWSWYLANDMQLYVLSPLLLVPLFYNKIIGGIISAVTIGLAIVIDGVISDTKGYHVQAVPQAGEQPPDNFKNYYIPVWTRFGPYVVGLLTGYVLYKSKCKCKIPKILNITIWILYIHLSWKCITKPETNQFISPIMELSICSLAIWDCLMVLLLFCHLSSSHP
ncbi:hypothetical protein ACF0H5_005907 [Mactra antiquata]